MKKERAYNLIFASVYPLYIKKVESKGRTKAELDEVVLGLMGYNAKTLQREIDKN